MSNCQGDDPVYPLPDTGGRVPMQSMIGLTKREHFAAEAMKGFLAAGHYNITDLDLVSDLAVLQAEQLIYRLNNAPRGHGDNEQKNKGGFL